MKTSAALTAFFFAKDFTPYTRRGYERSLTAFFSWAETHTCELHPQPVCDVEDVDKRHFNEFLARLRVTPSVATGKLLTGQTLHGYARVIKAFLNWCIKDDMLPERVTKKLDMPKKEVRVIPVFTPTQVNQLFKACERPGDIQYPWIAERDKAIVAILLDTGIRQAELCGLTLDRVRLDKQDSYIIVFGKGRKEREIGLGQASRQQLHRYIHRFRPHAPGVNHVFLTRDRRPLAAHGLEAVMLRLKTITGITGMRCSCHDFRHTFAYNYLANGGDLFKLSRLLGHTDIATTQGYLRAFQSRDARKGFSVLDKMREQR
ncbi:MAG TPA: tyrosine-type recombinase/integrase [Ktedonobacterales bacterium]|nr:tyrosine-type recombinase/integrase [Ktedonobacterales bacterium]